mgnify:CR=1 FL=1
MATIDLIVLGILKKEPMSAYDIQKLVEYRNISKWVKISTPSIYKKAIQLEEKGLIRGEIVKEGKMPEKAIYSLTEREKRVLILRYGMFGGEEKTQREIAEKLHISRSYVSRIEKGALGKLKKRLDSEEVL